MNGIYTPGKYFVSVGTAIVPAGGTMTLNGNGLYIFTVNSDLTTAVTGTILFAGVDPCNVWWRVPTQAAINNPTFPGNVVSNAGISLGTGTRLFGRALTTAPGIVTLAGNNIVGGCSSRHRSSQSRSNPAFDFLHLADVGTLGGWILPTAAAGLERNDRGMNGWTDDPAGGSSDDPSSRS